MRYAFADAPTMEDADAAMEAADVAMHEGRGVGGPEAHDEGYAGVALDLMEALATDTPIHTAVNVPNGAAITGMAPDDVVELSCVVDASGVRPVTIGAIPEPQLLLMKSVKLYERLTAEAIARRSRNLATAALMAHPLVLSYSRARGLVDEYLATNREFAGDWP